MSLSVVLDAAQARALVERIRTQLDSTRGLLLELYEGQGWCALGYDSWRACVVAEFSQSQAHLYRQLQAARTEREISPIGETPLPEWHLRQIARLPTAVRQEIARELAGADLPIKGLRRLIADKQRLAAAAHNGHVVGAAIEPDVQVGDSGARWRVEVGDARHLALGDGEAHLVITSPPYNARVNYPNYLDWLPWDEYWHELIAPALYEAYRVLCPGGRLCLNLPNVVRQDVAPDAELRDKLVYRQNNGRKWSPPGSGGRPWSTLVEAHLYPLAEQIGFLPRERIQWIKGPEPETVTTTSTAWGTFRSAANPVLRAVGEPIYVFSKERFDRPDVGVSDISAADFKRDTRNVWFVPAIGLDPTAFPASFPRELPRRLMRLYSFVDDLVVDPFVGSGTTIQAALETNRRAYGCDIDPSAARLAIANVLAAR